MTRWIRVAAAVLLAAYAAFGVPDVRPAGQPASVSDPSREMKVQVQPVLSVVRNMSPIDRLWLQYIYSNAAKVVRADQVSEPAVVTSTEGLRAIHVAILKFIWKGMAGNPPGKYEKLSSAIEKVFADTIGDKQRELTPELREKACEMFDAIAWAGLGKDE